MIHGVFLVQVGRVYRLLHQHLARRNRCGERHLREAGANAEDEIGLVQQLDGRIGARVGQCAGSEWMIFGEGTLAGQGCHDGYLHQFRKLAQLLPRLCPMHPLPHVQHRLLGGQ